MSSVAEALSSAELPPRYRTRWQEPFEQAVRSRLGEGMTVLDIGSGRNPAVERAERPPNTKYVGLDVSDEELRKAGAGVYDELVVADVATPVPALLGAIDLAVSWQVFEHVKKLDAALDNVHSYLRPGGTLISLFSGKWSAFGVVNRLIPNALAGPLVERVMRRRGTHQPVFRAYYHHCTYSGLRRITAKWNEVEIRPFFRGAIYFHFSPLLTRSYLAYENAVRRAGLSDLATHYLLIASR